MRFFGPVVAWDVPSSPGMSADNNSSGDAKDMIQKYWDLQADLCVSLLRFLQQNSSAVISFMQARGGVVSVVAEPPACFTDCYSHCLAPCLGSRKRPASSEGRCRFLQAMGPIKWLLTHLADPKMRSVKNHHRNNRMIPIA